jgi:hypothetical protein
MKISSLRVAMRGRLAVAAALVLSLSLSPFAVAAAAGPFDGLQGAWAGSGTIALNNGTKERLLCNVQYTVADDGANLQQALRCSSDSYKFQVNAFVKADAGKLSGNWTETTRNVTGAISGQVSGSRIEVQVAGGNVFSAKMIMATTGARQKVTIEPTGTDVSLVSVNMAKGH